MAGKGKIFHGVDFAKRYGSPVGLWFTAFVAILRMEQLVEDARTLKQKLEAATPEDERWFPWIPADVISYYSVGYVTCMEWHARSRIRDLLTFMPNKTTSRDIEKIRDSVVIEMLSANATIAGVVGGVTKINSLGDYIGVFERIFEALDIKEKPFATIKANRPGTSTPWVSGDQIASLQNLHPYRHNLVHEIGAGALGHINIRDTWSPEDAIMYGDIVLSTMQALEMKLAQGAPEHFPNLLNKDFVPVSKHQILMREIQELEMYISKIVSQFDTDDQDQKLWNSARVHAADNLKSEFKFLQEASMLFYRYEDLRTPLMDAAAQARRDYLKSIIDVVGSVWDLEADSVIEAHEASGANSQND